MHEVLGRSQEEGQVMSNTCVIASCTCGAEYYAVPGDAKFYEFAEYLRGWYWECGSCCNLLSLFLTDEGAL
jgi:hypothetical protein